ncbi:MAG TPA: transposase [Candidatus Lokiarchaeia archaeon]|nr:transposase [Candidatus Lokiarchaeia archaeon]
MPEPIQIAYIKPDHESRLITEIENLKSEILSCSRSILEESNRRVSAERMGQFVIISVVSHALGVDSGTFRTMLDSPYFKRTRDYISGISGTIASPSTIFRNVYRVLKHSKAEVERLASIVQDALQLGIGQSAREGFKAIYSKTKVSIVPNVECFLGLIKPSEIFAKLPVFQRGRLIPYLNARLYMNAMKITGIAELVGKIKTPVLEGETFYFRFAGELGFFHTAPGKNEFYANFPIIDQYLSACNDVVNKMLIKDGLLDLTVISIDSTNVPVDKKDKTGSKGTGSRGTFFGHKLNLAVSSECLPIVDTLCGGRQADVTLFDGVMAPVVQLATETGIDMWAVDADAGYSSPDVVDAIETSGAVPFVDINPKNSSLLKQLKDTAESLKAISRKALKELPMALRRSWKRDTQQLSKMKGANVPLHEKEVILQKILRRLAKQARKKGLTIGERSTERRLRKEITKIRRDIRLHGTAHEKKVGLTTVMIGTIEWMLVYAIRGQNEGINGIMKKRGDLIGDGQHTTWLHDHRMLDPHCAAMITGIKTTAMVKWSISGETTRSLRRPHNWRRSRSFFWVVIVVIFCR